MANIDLDRFDPTCKDEGAKWYACPATSSNRSPFVGCCKTDPCTLSGCAVGNLAPVSFNASAYGSMPDPSCGAASTFRSCVNIPKNDTTFWGCCKSDACNTADTKCPKNDLTAAVLDTASLQQAYSANGTTGEAEAEGGHSHTGVIVGAAVGGGVAVVAIIAILIFCLFKKRRARSRSAPPSSQAPFPSPEKTEYRHSVISEGTNTLSPGAPQRGLGILSDGTAAPPLYNSPKPPPFAAFGQHQYTPVAQTGEPQELPVDYTAGSSQRYSELPAEVTSSSPGLRQAPAELESPMISPQPFGSPRPSPRSQGPSRLGDGEGERPRTADTTYKVSMGGFASPR
ncbi:uncharacterized protein N0V89_008333 [Didymosphaeria variabile]|uniref:Mid2 domain-containing protein n=1 Tax=Didymosphaeria variabile TaxID=1932322 RepID=A0A9W9C8E9_9PLEO|nr:uncharacterized protein N0V89_008333 [Didymosphaeria variabile]KAJ4349716.1 hypothetical protein N0V89_008333 [Didymosphaeria variabile]